MSAAPEPALPLAWPVDHSPDRLAITEANRAAAAWLAAPSLWPVPVTLIVGPEGSGKTHLARWFAAHHRAQVIENAERQDPESLFHAWNAATRETPLLLTSPLSPRDWGHGLPDLASRLAATPLVRLGEPDDELLGAVLAKLFGERGIKVGDDLIRWLVVRIERSLVAAQAVVAALDAAALSRRRAITIPFAREVVDGQGEFGF
ncbi:HdaA/DnaA family protein [Sandarakinorhabdus oryzae]|uniref:HdaA/DnaA family protein n=1 Tax=Sandarakinorhabdus oryzae TaxID=2675220 RepID=UPI0012E308D0|nr:chromosomal replication initiator DnaA [Sandarakinorhabdus oryzae]